MTRFVPFCASIGAVFGLLVACKDDRIVLATVEEDEADAAFHAPRCATTADCANGTYCDRRDCSHTAGFCHTAPTFCANTEDPVCGEDGVTYFNDCIRELAGVSCSTVGECFDNAVTCDTNGVGCLTEKGQVCAQFQGFGDSTTCKSIGGHCWVLPSTCPASSDDQWDECSTDPNALKCQFTCQAIRSGRAFTHAKVCQ